MCPWCHARCTSVPVSCSCHGAGAALPLQEEDVLRLEEQARKDAEKRAAAERRARERRNKARATTGSTRATRGGAAAAASSASSSSSSRMAAAPEPPTISSRASSGAAASTSGTPVMNGAALRSAARTGRVRSWGRAVPVAKPGRGGLSKRAAAAASLEADPLTFMREIGKNQLLTAEQERRLATFVQERQQLIEAAQSFRRQHGRPPSEVEWAASAGVEDGAEVRRSPCLFWAQQSMAARACLCTCCICRPARGQSWLAILADGLDEPVAHSPPHRRTSLILAVLPVVRLRRFVGAWPWACRLASTW